MAAEFEKHVFISYAHLDNIPITQGQDGWVSRLHTSLYSMLSRRLGCEARIWRDSKLKGDDVFSDEIVGQFSRSAVLLSIISPRYVKSDWCKRELNEFCEAAAKTTGVVVGNKSRALKVLRFSGGACQIWGRNHAAALSGVARRSQKSSKRPLSLQHRSAMMLLAPETVQCMPDRLRRVPMTTLHPDSSTPVEVHRPCA